MDYFNMSVKSVDSDVLKIVEYLYSTPKFSTAHFQSRPLEEKVNLIALAGYRMVFSLSLKKCEINFEKITPVNCFFIKAVHAWEGNPETEALKKIVRSVSSFRSTGFPAKGDRQKELTHISFSQGLITDEVRHRYLKSTDDATKSKYKTLYTLNKQYGGLCEIICNRVIHGDLLGKGSNEFYLTREISLESLTQNNLSNTHLLSVHSIFTKCKGMFCGSYADNIFSPSEQAKLTKKDLEGRVVINRDILRRGLEGVDDGETIKFQAFDKRCISFLPVFRGHSLLIKKISDNDYIFFDPNKGETRKLTLEGLALKIDRVIYFHGKNLYLTKASDFHKVLTGQGVLPK